MSLASRTEAFDRMCARFECARPANLIAVHKIPDHLLTRLRTAAAIYMSSCLPGNQFLLDEDELMRQFEAQIEEVPNVTPNGMIVPKRHTVIEYNYLVRAFAAIIDNIGISDLISSWHVPLNLRVKLGQPDEQNLKRNHPTEDIHSDSWAGESTESCTAHIPIFGDIERNHLIFMEPPQDFDEEWLKPRPSYRDGADVVGRYGDLDFRPEKGSLILADFAQLHGSTRLPGAGPRISIDTTFVLSKPDHHDADEKIHPWRENERATPQTLSELGSRRIFYFPDSAEQQVDVSGGFKHPTNLEVMELTSA
jgi:hypothetical protein